jgi:hypothetical protein
MHPSRNDGHFLPILSETFPNSGPFAPRRRCPAASDLKIREKFMPAAPIGDAASGDSSASNKRWEARETPVTIPPG